ncbi:MULTISPECIES: porin [Burkholderia]|uniref:porin n=1 Tax=Burkholderia TaxID=32008 RepID=UPI000F57E1E2|nr:MULTISPECIES: porin [Burkholderia]RQR70833.1 porin [Burkholderia sp. Bp9011]RQR83643.1 porin [Burkholderia sp. Bp9010]RQS52147.1 porin [Burkholderia sp. Bp8984]RQS64373.1 porin [Burkholderia sp. Bp8977]RQU50424.1 porin [Burkholderia cenocepacia]
MKKTMLAVSSTLICGAACAQSSVTLYGLIDAGVTYTNHVNDSSGKGASLQFQSGVAQSSRWGMRGTEDLGGGTKAIFTLESSFDVGNGKLLGGGAEFGLQSFVGLSGNWGTVTLGRQYDFIGYYFPAYAIAANTPAGLLGWSLPTYASGGYALDNHVWGDLVNNAVKYESPVIGGFTFGAMYGFGNVAGSLGQNSSSNFYVSYANGPFSAALAYMSIHNATPSANSVEYAAGAAYNVGKARVFGYVTDVRLSSGDKARATTVEGGVSYLVTPALSLAGGLQYQARNNNVGSANQLILSADYFLSKRTDVYLVGTLAHDHGFGTQAEAALGASSNTSVQTAVRVAIRHKF